MKHENLIAYVKAKIVLANRDEIKWFSSGRKFDWETFGEASKAGIVFW